MHDSETDLLYQYTYDSLGRLMSSTVMDVTDSYNPRRLLTTRQTYDSNNQLSGQYWQVGDTSYSESYTYSKTTGLLATHKPAVGNTLTYGYDTLQRLSTVTGGIYGKTYTYRDISGTDKTTTQVAGLTYNLPTDIVFGYEYDDLGNVEKYTESGNEYAYSYDAQNQLTTVKTNDVVTHTYEYDAAGNITETTTPTGTHTYTYDTGVWKDLLKYFDGEEIVYDASGNPTTYYNGTEWNMTWAEGRRLVTAKKADDSLEVTYTYDSDGLRLSKNVNGTVHNYYYAGGKLMRQTDGTNTLDFFYDASGNPYALKYNGTLYYYITNLQGDVLHIVNTSGTPVVSYSYSPYGEIESVTDNTDFELGTINPLRYRGYVYDEEMELYYLQSRYYDPTTCRFINADGYASTGQGVLGNNMFAYCLNNPVNCIDTMGSAAIWYYLIVDSDMGFIHRAVQEHIRLTYGVRIEVSLSTYGRADILSAGAVWEIKHGGISPGLRTVAAQTQAANYVLQNEEVTHLGNAGAYSGYFYISCMDKSYLVEYRTPAQGVVLYTVTEVKDYKGEHAFAYYPKKKESDAKQVRQALGVAGAGILIGAILGRLEISHDLQFSIV